MTSRPWLKLLPALALGAAGCELEMGRNEAAEEDTLGGGATVSISDGPGGFVNNPDNSRDTMKLVMPAQYANRITEIKVYTPDGAYFDTLYRATPDEEGDRQRYYGTRNIGEYPDNLKVKVVLADPQPDGTTKASSFVFVIPDPQERMD